MILSHAFEMPRVLHVPCADCTVCSRASSRDRHIVRNTFIFLTISCPHILKRKWVVLPSLRLLGGYLRAMGLSSRSRCRGRLTYDAGWVDQVSNRDVPLAHALGNKSSDKRTANRVIEGIADVLRFGTFILVGRDHAISIMQRALRVA